MTSRLKRGLGLAAVAVAAASLGGCWDSDGDETPPPAASGEVPDSAGASVAAYVSFLQGLVSDETSEPLGVNAFAAPADETSEPAATP